MMKKTILSLLVVGLLAVSVGAYEAHLGQGDKYWVVNEEIDYFDGTKEIVAFVPEIDQIGSRVTEALGVNGSEGGHIFLLTVDAPLGQEDIVDVEYRFDDGKIIESTWVNDKHDNMLIIADDIAQEVIKYDTMAIRVHGETLFFVIDGFEDAIEGYEEDLGI